MLPSALAYAALAYFGDEGRAVAAFSVVYVMIASIRFFWDLRRQPWFWITILVLGAIQAALVMAIPWSDGPYRGPVALIVFPAMMLDFAAVYWCVKLGENVIGTPAIR
jgi:hypothetical protein